MCATAAYIVKGAYGVEFAFAGSISRVMKNGRWMGLEARQAREKRRGQFYLEGCRKKSTALHSFGFEAYKHALYTAGSREGNGKWEVKGL